MLPDASEESDEALDLRDDWARLVNENAELKRRLAALGAATNDMRKALESIATAEQRVYPPHCTGLAREAQVALAAGVIPNYLMGSQPPDGADPRYAAIYARLRARYGGHP